MQKVDELPKENGMSRQQFLKDQFNKRLDILTKEINETEYMDVQKLRDLTFVESLSILTLDTE